jgi:hypothetical protein
MAEEKKSFVLYSDLIHTVRKMPLEKSGKLLLTMLEYVNDLNPVIDDVLIELVFEPIKQQMKRDLIKWESIKEKRSEAGKASAESKKRAKESADRKALLKLQKQQESTKLTSVESDIQSSTKSTVSVNVNGNVINDDVYTPSSSVPFYTIHQFENEVSIGQNEFTLHACRSSKHTAEDLEKFLREFIIQQKALTKLTWPNISDAKKHFISWASKQQKSGLINGVVSSPGIRRPLN